jgi:signal transduction histidine kinase
VGEKDIGFLEAYGPPSLAENDTMRILESLSAQAASALENTQLYGELAEREHRLAALVGRLIGSQEEQRRRFAYEVHDSFAQDAATAHRHLQAFAYQHPQSSSQTQEELDTILQLAKQTVGEARRIIANLHPTVLAELGLASAIGFRVEQLRAGGWQVSYEETLGEELLPSTVETTLFRVAQEALTNIRKHAHSSWVNVALLRLDAKVRLQVRDFGWGFEPSALSGVVGGSGERIGLSGMQEQVALVGGKFKLKSKPDVGTLVGADIPLPAEATRKGTPSALRRPYI